ncbi:MAG TPA: hypothetical protein DCY24_05100 [Rikenellaceae bacterium]|nr:hypothetical protein [Rikenellaceae bacterium]
MTLKNLFNEWEKQAPVDLSEEQMDAAFSKVMKEADRVESKLGHGRYGIFRNPVFRVVAKYSSAAAVAVCVTLAFVAVSRKSYDRGLSAHIQGEQVNMVELSTGNGEIRRITLPDSSKVTLNAGSVLIYPERFSPEERAVYLCGEAAFDVTGDPERCFIVKTSSISVKVYGTMFNITAYNDCPLVSTTLCKGSISAMGNHGEAPAKLVPGQKYTFDKVSGQASVTEVNTKEDTAWMDGDLCFRSESLHNIVKTIERRYGVRVYITTSKYDNDFITAKFIHGETLEDLMTALCKVTPGMSYRIINSNIYIK